MEMIIYGAAALTTAQASAAQTVKYIKLDGNRLLVTVQPTPLIQATDRLLRRLSIADAIAV